MLKQFFSLFEVELKQVYREKMTLIWVIFFPLFIMLLFGLIFGSADKFKIKLGVYDKENSAISRTFVEELKQANYFEVHEVKDKDNLFALMKNKQSTLVLMIGRDSLESRAGKEIPLQVYYDNLRIQDSTTQIAFLLLNQMVGDGKNAIVMEKKPISFTERELTYIEFLVPGLIGMLLLSIALFTSGVAIVSYKEKGILKRLQATPVNSTLFYYSHILSRLLLGLMQSMILMVCAALIFKINFNINLTVFLILITGIIFFTSLGLLIGTFSKNATTTNYLANFFFFPLVFLSGVYFPINMLPSFLQPLASVSPLTLFIDSFRSAVFYHTDLLAMLPNFLLILSVSLILIFISSKKFKLEK